jgi:hypothetical protein
MANIIATFSPGMDANTAFLISLVPFFMLLFIIVSGLSYAIPQQQPPQGG